MFWRAGCGKKPVIKVLLEINHLFWAVQIFFIRSHHVKSFLAYWLRSKSLEYCQHIDLWFWMQAPVLESVPLLICAGFVYCHCTGRWAVFDNTHSKDSGAFRWGLSYSHYHGPYLPIKQKVLYYFEYYSGTMSVPVYPPRILYRMIDTPHPHHPPPHPLPFIIYFISLKLGGLN